jgi:SNF2 family DNA or RNA helicase
VPEKVISLLGADAAGPDSDSSSDLGDDVPAKKRGLSKKEQQRLQALKAEAEARKRRPSGHLTFGGELLPFQIDSVGFFLELRRRGINGLLADDMGLGKTVQSIAVLVASYNDDLMAASAAAAAAATPSRAAAGVAGRRNQHSGGDSGSGGKSALLEAARRRRLPSLILAPLSTASNWESEFVRFAPGLKAAVLGTAADRSALLADFFSRLNAANAKAQRLAAATSKSRSGKARKGGAAPARRRRGADVTPSETDSDDDTHALYDYANEDEASRSYDVLVLPHDFLIQSHSEDSRRYTPQVLRTQWHYMIVDEAHRIKNAESRLTQRLQELATRGGVNHRLLLTGTPLQNTIRELWTLLAFLLPDVFGSDQQAELFAAIEGLHLGKEAALLRQSEKMERETTEAEGPAVGETRSAHTDAANVSAVAVSKKAAAAAARAEKRVADAAARAAANEEAAEANTEREFLLCRKMHEILGAIMVRREKRQVLLNLPTKREVALSVPTLPAQDACRAFLEGNGRWNERVARYIFMHPCLLFTEPQNITQELGLALPYAGGKLLALDVILQFLSRCNAEATLRHHASSDRALEGGAVSGDAKGDITAQPHLHKVLVFSQWTRMLDVVEHHCAERGWSTCRLDGTTRDRGALLESYRTDAKRLVFLLSKGAGGVGLNLQAADTVILLDVDYNPTLDQQAIARSYRVGQRAPVLVLRLVSGATAEQRMLDIARHKAGIEAKVLNAGRFDLKTQQDERDVALRQVLEEQRRGGGDPLLSPANATVDGSPAAAALGGTMPAAARPPAEANEEAPYRAAPSVIMATSHSVGGDAYGLTFEAHSVEFGLPTAHKGPVADDQLPTRSHGAADASAEVDSATAPDAAEPPINDATSAGLLASNGKPSPTPVVADSIIPLTTMFLDALPRSEAERELLRKMIDEEGLLEPFSFGAGGEHADLHTAVATRLVQAPYDEWKRGVVGIDPASRVIQPGPRAARAAAELAIAVMDPDAEEW